MAWKRPSLFRVSRVCGAAILIAAAIALVGFVLVKLAMVALAIFAAAIFTCLLWPLARRLEGWRVPRFLASFLPLLLGVALFAGAMAWIVPAAISEISENREQLTKNVKELWTKVSGKLPKSVTAGFTGGQPEAQAQAQAQPQPQGAQPPAEGQKQGGGSSSLMPKIFAGVAAGLITMTEVIGGLLLSLVLTFFLLRDGAGIANRGLGRLSRQKRAVFEPALLRSWKTLHSWIRGAAIIAAVDAIAIGAGLMILGVPLALPLALLTFIASFIPVVGATVAGGLAVLVAWATGGSTDALIALAIVVGVQQLESNVLEPMVMGRAVPLHPAAVLVAVTAGALLGGIAGAFAAVPLTAVAVAFFEEVYKRSEPATKDEPDSTERGEGPPLAEEPASPH